MAALVTASQAARAQKSPNPDSAAPLEITADQTLEWHRNNRQYVAIGNVVARQGTVTIMADTLIADYRETGASSLDIYRLTATGNVRIESQGSTATGGKAIYDVDKGTAVMTGNNLRLASPDQTVTAKDSFEYHVTEGRLSAIGSAHVIRGQDTLDADRVSAVFAEKPDGSREIKSLTADGNVVMKTPTETLTGAHGRYLAATNIAEITGDVTIRRGPNTLEGSSAEVNLTTNVSKMHSGPGEAGRVRGVFYPGSEDGKNGRKPGQQATPSPPPSQNTQQIPGKDANPYRYRPQLPGK